MQIKNHKISAVNVYHKSYLSTDTIMNIIFHFALMTLFFSGITSFYKYNFLNKTINIERIILNFLVPMGAITMIIVNIFYITLYYFQFDCFEKMKANNLDWPWILNPVKFKNELFDMLKTYFVNQFGFGTFFLYFSLKIFSIRFDFESLPSFSEFWITIWLSFLLEDFFFYWIHRLIHVPGLYWIHKKHHKIFNTIHISCVYTHWIEFVLGVAFPLLSGFMVFQEKFHIISLAGVILFRMVETHESHGGYEFKYTPFLIFPYMSDTAYHNYHHLKNIGNYSTYWILWDSMFGTNKTYMKRFESVKE